MSKPGKLDLEDAGKILKGALLAAFGVVTAAIAQVSSTGKLDWQTTGWLAVAAFFSVTANGIRKLSTDAQ